MRSPPTFSFNINENLRTVAPGATSTLNPTSNRHSVGDMNKLLEDNRDATSPTKKQPPPLNIKRSFSVGATSPTKRTETQPNTPTYRPRRISGAKMADRMAWIRDLEEKSSGKGSPGRAAMYKNLQGGVADKLARFESSNKDYGLNLTRTNSVSSRMAKFNDAYGIENGPGKRLSRTSTMDDEFRRKMEEVAEKAKKKVDLEGDQEALIAQVNRDAELALKEEKRRSLKMESAGPFKYAFNDKAGRKTDLVPDVTKTTTAVTTPPADEVDLESFTPTRRGSTKMPKFNVKDPNAVATSANPPVTLVEEKIAAPFFKLKDPNAVAASANPPVSMEPQADDGEYDPFNVMTYPVSKAMSAIKKYTPGTTKEDLFGMEASGPSAADGAAEEAAVSEPAAVDAPQVLEESKAEMADQPSTHIPALEPVEVVQPQATEDPKVETAIEQESQLEDEKSAPAIEPTGIITPEVKDDTKAEVAAEPAAKIEEKEVPQPTEQTTPAAKEETKVDETTQLTPKIEAKTSTIPIEPIALEPPRVEDDTKPETYAEPATAATIDSPSVEETTAEIPVINTTPPTPPAKKEMPVPKYLALRERAQKAAEIPSKPAPAPMPTSQTFSRLFGPPMTSGMGRSRSPSPIKVVRVAEVAAKEKTVETKEMPAPKETPSTEKPSDKELTTQEAEKGVPMPKETPIAAKNAPLEEKVPEAEQTAPKNVVLVEKEVSADKKPLLEKDIPVEKEGSINNSDVKKERPMEEATPIEKAIPMQAENTTPNAEEAPSQKKMPIRKVTPFSTSLPTKKDVPAQTQSSIQEEAAVSKAESPVSSLSKDLKATPTNISTTKPSPLTALAKEEATATPNMGGSSVGTISGKNSPAAPTFAAAAKIPTFADKS